MIPVNPGNVLPAYRTTAPTGKQRWQRHRLTGQDTIPFGLTAPRTRLLPMQIFIDDGNSSTDAIVWELRDPANDMTNFTLDDTQLERTALADGRYYITWKADERLTAVPDCGFWYPRMIVEGVFYDFEVLYVKDMCGMEDCELTLVADSCSMGDGVFLVTLQGNVYAASGYDYSLQQLGMGWSEISDSETFAATLNTGDESASVRIQVVTLCGLIMTRTYELAWSAGDPCGTVELTFVSENNNTAGVGNNPSFRLVMGNDTDKESVLYQTGYEQHLYLNPVWDTPDVNRNVNIDVNGNGNEIRRFTRSVTRQKFEFPDMPDFVLGFLAKAGDLGSVVLQEIETLEEVALDNFTFESKRQGALLNIGVASFDAEIEAFSGCQENFVLD